MTRYASFAEKRRVERFQDPGPCDVWCNCGRGTKPEHHLGKPHYCRTHGTTFIAPNPCPKGRGARKQGGFMLLAQLKNFVIDRLDLDEMFALSAFGKMVRSEYQNRNMPVPEWLTDQLGVLDREILARRRDELEKRLKEVKAQSAGLETTTEKRDRLAKEREELEKQLAGGVETAKA